MKSEMEIVAAIRNLEKDSFEDIDGRRRLRLISLLPYSSAKPWLKPEVIESDWHQSNLQELRAQCRTDLNFAWEKALAHRGISANLMADVIVDWVWLLCSQEEHQQVVNAPYENYGAPKLALAGQLLDMSAEIEPYEREAAERMARGEPCTPGCDIGCS